LAAGFVGRLLQEEVQTGGADRGGVDLADVLADLMPFSLDRSLIFSAPGTVP